MNPLPIANVLACLFTAFCAFLLAKDHAKKGADGRALVDAVVSACFAAAAVVNVIG